MAERMSCPHSGKQKDTIDGDAFFHWSREKSETMTPSAREFVSGTAAAVALGGAAAAGVHLAACAVAGGLVYAGLRLCLPAKKPKSIADASKALIGNSKQSITGLSKQAPSILDTEFRDQVENLISTLNLLIERCDSDADNTTIDGQFPERIDLLTDILKKYNDVTRVRTRTESVVSAIEHTHTIFRKASERFSKLVAKQIDQDAVELTVDARVYDELQNIHFD